MVWEDKNIDAPDTDFFITRQLDSTTYAQDSYWLEMDKPSQNSSFDQIKKWNQV